MNNEVLDIYSDDLTDAEAESLFSTTKESKRGDRRKIDYKKARRKARIDIAQSYDGLPLYDNLHQYSKNKIHCSCQLCRGKDCFGRHVTTEQEVKSRDEMLAELKELDENLLAEMILSILVYTLFSRMFDLMQPPAVKHSIAVV